MKRDGWFSVLRRVIAVLVSTSLISACATSKILSRPSAKNLDALRPGLDRALVLAELGAPIGTREADGTRVDTFAFDKGVGKGEKFCRALLHIGADLFTVFLWELVAWPAESLAAGINTKMQIEYDQSDKIRAVAYLDAKAAVAPIGSIPPPVKASLSKNQKIVNFVVAGYGQLMEDLRKGEGQYLTSLQNLLEIPAADRPTEATRIHGLSETYPDIAQFADKVAELYSKPALPTQVVRASRSPEVEKMCELNSKGSGKDLQSYIDGLDKNVRSRAYSDLIDGGKSGRLDEQELSLVSWLKQYRFDFKPGD